MPHEDRLLGYIQEQINAGYSQGTIKNVLLDAGYYIGDIEKTLQRAEAMTGNSTGTIRNSGPANSHNIMKRFSRYFRAPSFFGLKKNANAEKSKAAKKKNESSHVQRYKKPPEEERPGKLQPATLGERAKIGFSVVLIGAILLFVNNFLQVLMNPNFFSYITGLFVFNIVPFFMGGTWVMAIRIAVNSVVMISAFMIYRRGTERVGGIIAIVFSVMSILVSEYSLVGITGSFAAIAGGVAGTLKK